MQRRNAKKLSLNMAFGIIDMNHGSGGSATSQLVEEIFYRHFHNSILEQADDFAMLPVSGERCVVSTDTFVVSPLFFPGGNIGSLAVHGTVNDVAMSGATPRFLSAGFVLEEGLPLKDLDAIVETMAAAAKEAGVTIVAGDTKVVERGKGDGIFINTTGIGFAGNGLDLAGRNVRAGDRVIVSGYLGDHGVAIMASRENLSFRTRIVSDSAPLNGLVATVLARTEAVHCFRDPTRGGLATTLNEVARQAGAGIVIDESAIPVREEVQAACELLGLDPLYIANEGKLVCFCEPQAVDQVLGAMRAHPYGKDAAVIGEVVADNAGMVQMKTGFGGHRLVEPLIGEPLPRIC